MSGLAVCLQRDGRPVDPVRLERMLRMIAHRGPNGITRWVDGPIALGHGLMHTTPESLHERQPVSDGSVRLVWDGRLDNRDELLARFKSEGIRQDQDTDPDLVLAAYRLWGASMVEHILGDFALVLWDARTRTLLAARDRIGLKPLYYHEHGSTLYLASEAKAILSVLDRMPEPDDELILAMLLSECRESDHHRSPFAGIHRLPPGHVMTVTDGHLQLRRYWQIDPSTRTVYRKPQAYVEHFRALFEQAVACRTRSAFPIGCFLSGGLDSSSIAVTAASTSPALEAFTVFSDHPGSDERRFARQAAQAAGIPLWEFDDNGRNPLEGLDERLWQLECHRVLTHGDAEGFHALVNSRRCRVVLDGEGGDALLDEFGYLADVLIHRGPAAFYRETSRFSRWVGEPFGEIAYPALAALLPATLKYVGKALSRRIPPAWIARPPAGIGALHARLRQPRTPLACSSFAQRFSSELVFSPLGLLGFEVEERAQALAGREIRYPFLDSRLVEFVLSIPWDQRCHDGERKWLLRQAMRDRLPDSLLLRQGKGDWTAAADHALLALCQGDRPEPLANRSGMLQRYINLRQASRTIERYQRGDVYARWPVWWLVTLDHWLKRFWKEGGDAHVEESTITQEAVHEPEVACLR